ncbi:MAG: hypothetical protein N2448_08980 [Caloramator sp.]|nr:hypothetical protein [Caloramator sp.]
MTDKEKLISFEKYMRDLGYDNAVINYNINVVKLLINNVLIFFQETLETIDSYCFEEFTDMITLIDSELGGRNGIPKMLDAMMTLTEFLKINKLIKGGKIAYYKRMFSDVDYYLDKYDRMTGRKDDSREFIKDITTNRFSSLVIKAVEDINLYDIETMDLIDRILNDVPVEKEKCNENILALKAILCNLKLLEEKNTGFEATKKGRCLSRLSAEERYAAILYLLLYSANWSVINSKSLDPDNDIKDIIPIFSSIFKDVKELSVDINEMLNIKEDDVLIEISSDRFRIARAECLPYSKYFIDICFKGMGLIDIIQREDNSFVYLTNDFGQRIFKIIYGECIYDIKIKLDIIGLEIKNRKDYENIEKRIIKFIMTYGSNSIIWDYLGQILLLEKNYNYAYTVLKYAYENCNKRSKVSKSILYHLVLCCRKLKLDEDVKIYEKKLQSLQKA